jgi:hypothetical protein
MNQLVSSTYQLEAVQVHELEESIISCKYTIAVYTWSSILNHLIHVGWTMWIQISNSSVHMYSKVDSDAD